MSIRLLTARHAAENLAGTPYFGYGQAPGYLGNTPYGVARLLIKAGNERYYIQGEISSGRTLNSYYPNMYGGIVPLQESYNHINDALLQLDRFVEGESYQLSSLPFVASIDRPVTPGGLSAAILRLPETHASYFQEIGDKSRNMSRKAEKNGFRIALFDKNDYLDDLYAIHTSLDVRQGQPLAAHYRTKLYANYHQRAKWEMISEEWWGAFSSENRLVGYIYLPGTNGEYLTSRIMGHGDYLRFGIMNALVNEVIKTHAGERGRVMYGMYEHGTDGLRQFKSSLGFQPVPCLRYAYGPGQLRGKVLLRGMAMAATANPYATLKAWSTEHPRIRKALLQGRARMQKLTKP